MTIVRLNALRLVLAFSLVLAAAGSSVATPAANTTWSGASGSSWATAGNWSTGVPTANHAILDSSGTNRTIVLPAAATASQLITTDSGYGLTTGTLTLSDQLYLYGSGGSLTLSGGARVTTPNSSIGTGSGDTGNTLSVGSTLVVNNTINVGYDGSSNALQLTGGGSLTANAVWIGGQPTATGNSVSVGSGATLTSGSSILVGDQGDANTLTVSGSVGAQQTIIGNAATAGGNTLTIAAGGRWSSSDTLVVGLSGTGNNLLVTGGTFAMIASGKDVVIGSGSGASGNGITVNGGSFSSGSSSTLIVGAGGSGNSFTATGGAVVTSSNARIGNLAGATGNAATVQNGATWTISNKLRVGSDGDGNSLAVLAGGTVSVNSDVFVGGYGVGSNVSNNSITVSGSGSRLAIASPSASLVVSYGTGTNNVVTVADGGTLAVPRIDLGPGGKLAIGAGGAAGNVSPAAVISGSYGGTLQFKHNDANHTFANAITGSVSVVQSGPGRTVINGTANTYTGKTTVSSGTLALAGATNPIASSGTIAVDAGSVLQVGGVTGFAIGSGKVLEGTGTVSGAVQMDVGSILSPAAGAIGTLTFDSTLAVLGTLKLDVSGTSADRIAVASGALTLGPASILDFTVGSPLTEPAYILAMYSSLSGTFGSITNLPTGYTVDYNYLSGNQVALVPVPEPASLALIAAGGCLAAVVLRRRRSR